MVGARALTWLRGARQALPSSHPVLLQEKKEGLLAPLALEVLLPAMPYSHTEGEPICPWSLEPLEENNILTARIKYIRARPFLNPQVDTGNTCYQTLCVPQRRQS